MTITEHHVADHCCTWCQPVEVHPEARIPAGLDTTPRQTRQLPEAAANHPRSLDTEEVAHV